MFCSFCQCPSKDVLRTCVQQVNFILYTILEYHRAFILVHTYCPVWWALCNVHVAQSKVHVTKFTWLILPFPSFILYTILKYHRAFILVPMRCPVWWALCNVHVAQIQI